MREKKLNWRYLPLTLVAIYAIFPLLLLFMNAFKKKNEIIMNPLGIPNQWSFGNFSRAWQQGHFGTAYMNTLIITLITVLLVLIFSALAAYGITHLYTPGANILIGYLFISMSLPIGFVPIFFMAVKLGLINSYWGVIIPYVGGGFAFNVFLMRAFMLGIPKDLLDSAKVDGCGNFGAFLYIITPLTQPAFIVVAIFTTLGTWNEIILSNAILQDQDMRPVSVSFLTFSTRHATDWSLMAAGGVLTVIPMVILFLFMTRKFITGMQEGGVKF
jgi:raffinose/stachyose/melibiose transport system permease protein